ncbi:MAG TPA: type II secretion protein F [Microbacterium sp.]|nr:type II secretion protein F [Microbacterium sp.]
MSFLWGGLLAAGLLFALSPWLWPPSAPRQPREDHGAAARLLEEAGMSHVRPRVLATVCLLLAVVAAAVVWLVLEVPVLAVCAAAFGAAAPVLWLRSKRTHLIRARRGLWSDVCDHLVSAVRAGMSLPDAVSSLAVSAPPLLRPAFASFARDIAASGHFDSSALRLKALLADSIADRIVETLRMARHVGGTELPAVLRALSAAVRADAALRSEVEARQSWIRGAAVLGVVAPWAILALLSLRPEGARAYASPEGIALVIAGGFASILAYRLMLGLGRLPEPRRWLG